MFVGAGVMGLASAASAMQIEMCGSMRIEVCGAPWAEALWCYGLWEEMIAVVISMGVVPEWWLQALRGDDVVVWCVGGGRTYDCTEMWSCSENWCLPWRKGWFHMEWVWKALEVTRMWVAARRWWSGWVWRLL